jgi:diguanylate cyclase (GGDEF)-like protein/PAS domain S-box-containing protein
MTTSIHAAPGEPALSAAVTDAFLAHSDDLMVLFAGDGTIRWASPSADRIFGVAPDELVGRNGFEMIHPDDQERAFAAFATMPSLGDQVRLDIRVVTPSGRVRWVEEVATNLLDQPGVAGVVGHLRDITERRAIEQAALFQSRLLDAVGQATIARDNEGRVIYWNEAAETLFGWTTAEALGQRLSDLVVSVADDLLVIAEARMAQADARMWTGEIRVRGKGDRVIPILSTTTPVHDESGRHIGTIGVSTDMTETIEARRRIESAHQRLADAQASAHLGSFELDLRTRELIGSDELWRILGRPPSDLRRLEHVHPDDRDRFRSALEAAIAGEPDVSCTHRIVRPDGSVRWVVSRNSQLHGDDAGTLVGTVLDVTERHAAEEALRHQATHDPLTGLPNRRLFVAALERALASPAAGDIVVLFVDLDDFKTVNDRIGHVDADALLGRIGARIAAAVPEGGSVGRLGGDEFVVCFAGDPSGPAGAAAGRVPDVVAAVQAAIREPFVVRGTTLVVDASIGVAVAAHEHRAEVLLRNADVAMYAAKQAGGGRAEVFDDALHERDRRRAELAGEVRLALDAGHITTFFQPEVDLATGALIGFEALARWCHPERGMIGPDEFIPLAEETGLIGAVGRRVLEQACAALARWDAEHPELALTVGVNVSPLQLADPAFPDVVRRAIGDAGILPRRLCLELTESTLMDVDVAAEAIARLRAAGAVIAIDDFGTGYSSFGRLKSFPVDYLKIDRSFVADIGAPADDVILTTMVGLARSLGVAVIAEGLETEEQHRFLAGLGCHYGQGYLWSRPVPENEADLLVTAAATP